MTFPILYALFDDDGEFYSAFTDIKEAYACAINGLHVVIFESIKEIK